MSESTTTAEPPVQAPPKTAPAKPRPRTQPPYAVIIENDDEHTMDYVIEVLQKVFGKPLEDALLLTLEAHEAGEAQVWSGSLEVAELKRDQVRGFGPDIYAGKPVKFPLGVRIEPLAG